MRNYQNRNEQRKSVECRSELTSVTMLGLIFREIVFSVPLFEIYLVLCELGTSKVSYQSDTANALEFSNFQSRKPGSGQKVRVGKTPVG